MHGQQTSPILEETGPFRYTAPYGIGICSYNPAPFSGAALQPDSGGATTSDYVLGLLNKDNWRKPSDPGTLVVWGWGVSRLIDYFETDPDFDADKVAVEGHSRYGKAALVTAAYDDRITVAWPSDSGAFGTKILRRTYGETLDSTVGSTGGYYWLSGNAMKYAGAISPREEFPRRVEYLDVDAHTLVALIAPRAVFDTMGTDNPPGFGDAWADPRGVYLGGLLASPAYELLGWPGMIIPPDTLFTTSHGYIYPATCGTNPVSKLSYCDPSAESVGGTPPFDTAFIDGTIGWRRQKEGHTPVPRSQSKWHFGLCIRA
jgi:hypothetical protein